MGIIQVDGAGTPTESALDPVAERRWHHTLLTVHSTFPTMCTSPAGAV